MDNKYQTKNKKIVCNECKNEFDVENKRVGDVVECPHCGMEYEVLEVNDAGESSLTEIEEQK